MGRRLGSARKSIYPVKGGARVGVLVLDEGLPLIGEESIYPTNFLAEGGTSLDLDDLELQRTRMGNYRAKQGREFED